jgi:hypothetical protein
MVEGTSSLNYLPHKWRQYGLTSSILMLGIVGFSEMLVPVYRTTKPDILENCIPIIFSMYRHTLDYIGVCIF